MKITIKAINFFLISLILFSCGSEQSNKEITTQTNTDKVYRHSIDGKPTSLDPIKAASIYSNMLVVNIFDTLYSYKYLARPYQLKPNLARDMPVVSDDGLTYTIEIKKGVKISESPFF